MGGADFGGMVPQSLYSEHVAETVVVMVRAVMDRCFRPMAMGLKPTQDRLLLHATR